MPPTQTCCGQPAYNSGDRADAIALARKVVDEFEGCDYVVAPSGSCGGMIRTHYAELFADDAAWLARARRLAARRRASSRDSSSTCSKLERVPGTFRRHASPITTAAPACASSASSAAARAARARCPASTLNEMAEPETCCGFGGTFAVKFGEISARLADNKCGHIEATRRRRGRAGRSRLHAEHRRAAAPARRHEDAGAARRRGARRASGAQRVVTIGPSSSSHASRFDALQGGARTTSCTTRSCSEPEEDAGQVRREARARRSPSSTTSRARATPRKRSASARSTTSTPG